MLTTLTAELLEVVSKKFGSIPELSVPFERQLDYTELILCVVFL